MTQTSDGTRTSDGVPTTLTALHLPCSTTERSPIEATFDDAGIEARIHTVDDSDQLLDSIDRHSPDILVVDLPVSEERDPGFLDRVSGLHPEVSLVFRWPEDRSESASVGFRNAIHAAWEMNPHRDRASRDPRELLSRSIRQQEVVLQLSKLDPWELKPTVERITEVLVDVLHVSRVTIWEIGPDGRTLHCLDNFAEGGTTHDCGDSIPVGPRYLSSLQQSLTISANDARNDPRTSEFLDGYLIPAGIRSMLDIPIRRGGEVVGVICHEHVGEELRWWSIFDRCIGTYAAAVLARALEVRERRAVQEQVHQLERLRALGEMAGGIAHDLNNQLGIVLGNLEVAARGSTDPTDPTTASVFRARAAAEQVGKLVDDLLDIGRGGELRLETVDLSHSLREYEGSLRSVLRREVTFRLDAGEEPLPARIDDGACRRIILNLVKNAGEAIRGRGTVTLAAEMRETDGSDIHLPVGRCVVVTVSDDGRGMDAETVARIFEPFFTTKRGHGHGGTGLGLASSFGLAEQLGGTIRCETQPNRGSRFEWWVPALVESSSTID